ncbi:MAG: RNA polymerase sigma factor [Rhodanobacteraceae bacterium]
MAGPACAMTASPGREGDSIAREHAQALGTFLRQVERRALRMAEFAAGNREEALDLVQDAMLGFVRNYAAQPTASWPPLFWRVLDSRINDWHRRQSVRGRWRAWLAPIGEDAEDPIAAAPDPREPGPLTRLADGEATAALEAGLRALPLRQRQAFLLRIWEGLDVADTAAAMRCSEGSVKTHLSRALSQLRRILGEHQ